MNTLEKAIAITAKAHEGQVDKAGAPYILHPLRVMMAQRGNDDMIVAVLHDVVEDCPEWSFERLLYEGFPEHIVDALRALTKQEGEDYFDFVRRAASNPIARRVKLADCRDNSDTTRIPSPTEHDTARFERYRKAIEILKST